jgi:two-component system, OmpR family, alkaline phosphatase synthesis response regulator PhoP
MGKAERAQAVKILLVEDEEGLVLTLEDALRGEGHEVHAVREGIGGQKEAATGIYDLLILDVMLPGRDGFQICQNLRSSGITTPILMLTARSTTIDTVMGLRLGADDYLAKPFDMQVLLARVQALLRRSRSEGGEGGEKTARQQACSFRFGEFLLDMELMQLFKGDDPIPLNVQEYRILEVFARNPDRVISREKLLIEAWGYDEEITTRTVDVHMARLRHKLGEKDMPRHLVTARGYGYKLVTKP